MASAGGGDALSFGLCGSQGPGGLYVETPVRVTMLAHHCTRRGTLASSRLRGASSVSVVAGPARLFGGVRNMMLSPCKLSKKVINESGPRKICDGSLYIKDMVGDESRFRGIKGKEGQMMSSVWKNRFGRVNPSILTEASDTVAELLVSIAVGWHDASLLCIWRCGQQGLQTKRGCFTEVK